ncbi:SufD family Fe-S cluster assembly protein [Candidatus Woesearchaeota archaeon]|nr:SufD family Fe-S cluster assembly protein [Candidatus Woesearchaeota archaeon]
MTTILEKPYGLHVNPKIFIPVIEKPSNCQRVIHSENAKVTETDAVPSETIFVNEPYKNIFRRWCLKIVDVTIPENKSSTVKIISRHSEGIFADHWNIRIGKGSEALIIDESEGQGYVCRSCTIIVDEESRLNFVLLNKTSGVLISAHTIIGKEKSEINMFQAHKNCKAFTSPKIILENNAKGKINCIYNISKDNHIEIIPTSEHIGKDSSSSIEVFGVLDDNSSVIINGLAKINSESFQSNGFQKIHSLTLSKDAKISILPNLEINNNEVKCSHSASVSNIDPEHMHYLRSRGVPEKISRTLIVKGFIESRIEKFPQKVREDARRILGIMELKDDE